MDESILIRARQKAERAVKGMGEGPLKVAAFEVILSKLLQGSETQEPARRHRMSPDTLKGRVLAIRDEGFFKTQRTLYEVREALSSHGWHYPPTTLSGAMQALRSEEHTSELQSHLNLVCRLLLA